MLRLYDSRTRRDFLNIGGLTLGGLTLPGLLAARAAAARSSRSWTDKLGRRQRPRATARS